jgi:transcriptional antiterminator RfaH
MHTWISGWYLIYTMPRHEKKVFNALKEIELNAFLPTVKKLHLWRDRKKYMDDPLFPSYVFVYLSNLQNYYAGIGTKGAIGYVKTGDRIARVSNEVVDNIKLATQTAADMEVSNHNFKPGVKLNISKGVLTGLSCEIVECDNLRKLLVRVDILRRNVLVTLPAEYLIGA